MEALTLIWFLLQVVIAITLIFPVLSYFIYRVNQQRLISKGSNKQNDYGIIVTAFKNSQNLDNVVRSLLKLRHENFIIYVVADGCNNYFDTFHDPRVVIIKPETLLANQVRSHFLAIDNFKRPHNIVTIIDSDNLVDPDYLSALDPFFNEGYEAVQGVRTAKNLDTNFACLDALNETYYVFYDRRVLFSIGSSSMLSGSGMAFTVRLYRQCLEHSNSTGAGFDKILQKEIITRGHRIAFAKNAIVYDEKTSASDQLVKQRARWMNTWFKFWKYGYQVMWQGIAKFDRNRLLFGFLLTRPPLFMLVISVFFLVIINIFIDPYVSLAWILLSVIFISGFFIALRESKADKRIYQAMLRIPSFIFMQILSLFKAKKANEISVATEHRYNKEIESLP